MKILLTGDSLIARKESLKEPMLNAYLKKKVPKIKIVNTAISGNNSNDLRNRFAKDVMHFRGIDKLFLLIGTNDLAENKQVSKMVYQENLQWMITQLKKKYTASQIFFITPPAVDEKKQKFRNNELIKSYINCLMEVANRENCVVLDFYTEIINQPDFKKIINGTVKDGLHFGKEGYDLLSDIIVRYL
ncbi:MULTISPECIES: GDSL-type esterase/lipase family protein [Enterococcus]|uniref:GDSL-type esterase/lipase family protein n=1 Tax=Enterococcus TaxID=1350 RepID=UPI00065E564D|nr:MULTISPECIES: GDSL-type esterase/lipase family protein [Enterococcus]KAF1300176.1 hypothetical protein BAU16_13090 [Enterococcus sp. JM9B]